MKAVILAGGGGTRLWPLSTKEKPKQFQKILTEKTLLEEAVDRLDFLKISDIYLAINKNHLNLVKEICPYIKDKNIIIEPDLRDTASCIGLAASVIGKRHPNEVMAVIYADHYIENKKEFQEKLKIAEQIAKKENTLNIVEVEPTEPNTNYGYVKIGKLLNKVKNTEIFKLEKFVEKPSLNKAKEFIKSGNYLWNTGIYVWKAKTLLDFYKKIVPDTYKKLKKISESYDTKHQGKILKSVYPSLQKISIDYAIMEKIDPKYIRIIKAKNLGLSDLGTWETVIKLSKVKNKNTKLLDAKNCLIFTENKNKPVIIIGLNDIIFVDTNSGVFISKKSKAVRIKELL